MASRIIGILAVAAAVGWLQPSAAYGQTAEGTVITNTASVTYTDANTNGGTAAAASVHVDDVLPSEVTYISALQDAPTWTFSNTGNDLDADLTGTLAPAASRFFWIRVQVN